MPTNIKFAQAVNIYAMHTVASALRLYAQTGMKANSVYTPSAMLKAAERYTGKKFKRGQYMEAAKALVEKADEIRRTKVKVTHG